MDDNMILSDVIEQLIVENHATGEQFAVITHEDVFTASDNIVVRLKPRTDRSPQYSMRTIPTSALVRELQLRTGVKTIKAASHKGADFSCTGPAIVLIVDD